MDFSYLEGYMDKTAGVDKLYEKALEVACRLPEKYSFFEIGSWRGGSAVAIMQAIKDSGKTDRWMFTIDPYGSKPFGLGDKVVIADHYHEEDYRYAMKFMSDYALDNKLNHCHFRMLSGDYFNLEFDFWHKGKKRNIVPGFAYLDGEHTPRDVLAEFTYFNVRMPKGGAIVIDDFPYWEGKYPSLDKLINECPKDNFRVYYDKS